MKLRLSGLVLATIVVAMAFLGRASAVTKVGGGASAFEVEASVAGLVNLAPGPISDPPGAVVILPATGSETPITKQITGPASGAVSLQGVSFQVGFVSTRGTLRGTPYAQSSATTAGLTIQGSSIRAVHTECIWDLTGSKGSTTVVDAFGRSFMPRPNTTVTIPGGYIVLNEQRYETFEGAQVITVKGAHIYLFQKSLLGTTLTADIAVAVSACDPLWPAKLTAILD